MSGSLRAQPRVDGDAVVDRQAGAFGERGRRRGADADDDEIGLDAAAAREMDDLLAAVAGKAFDADADRQPRRLRARWRSATISAISARNARPSTRGAASTTVDLAPERPRGRRELEPDEAAADDRDARAGDEAPRRSSASSKLRKTTAALAAGNRQAARSRRSRARACRSEPRARRRGGADASPRRCPIRRRRREARCRVRPAWRAGDLGRRARRR